MLGVLGSFPTPTEPCRVGLPSSSAVEDLLDGKVEAIVPVVLSMAARGVLIGAGAALFGVKTKDAVRAGIGGALFIEAFVFGYIALNRKPA
jgi:hypothetical protein